MLQPMMIAHDLFAGAGGWDLAAQGLGIEAHGVENMKEARATRDAAGLLTIHDDVWTFGELLDAGLRSSDPARFEATLQLASPPCQTFSQAGKGKGRKALDDVLGAVHAEAYRDLAYLKYIGGLLGDERTALVLTPLHFATQYDYQYLAWEQVPTVLPVWEACADVLRAQGWSVWTGLLHAEQYGVPQTRKRAFLLASRHHTVNPPVPTHSRYHPRTPTRLNEGVQKWVSMAEALGWADTTGVVSNYGSGGDPANRGIRMATQPSATVTSKIDRNLVVPDFLRMTTMPNSAVRDVDQPAPTIAFGHDAASCQWHWKEDEDRWTTPGSADDRAWPGERPSPTIVGTFHPEIVAAPGYRTTTSRQNQPHSVRITVQEAGILQSFPADYPWQGAKGKQFLQCGNAVPVLLAQAALAAAAGIEIATDAKAEVA